jgi:hypothetical protein
VDETWANVDGCDALATELHALPQSMYKKTAAWLRVNEPFVRAQLGNRLHPYTTGAVEKALTDVGGELGNRAALFRNRRRTDLLLGLLLLQL